MYDKNNPFNSDSNQFGLPKDYFSKSATAILNKIEWEEEHKTYTNLLEQKNKNGFSLPFNYFSSKEIALELIDYPALNGLNKQNYFSVPANYFEEAGENELAKVMAEGENADSTFTVLLAIAKQNNFKVGADYFLNSEKKIQAKNIKTENTARIVKLFSLRMFYAVAAILVIAIGLWSYSYFFKIVETKDCGTLACIDKADLLKAKTLESFDNDELYDLVDSKKLEQNLENKSSSLPSKTSDSSQNDNYTDELLDTF